MPPPLTTAPAPAPRRQPTAAGPRATPSARPGLPLYLRRPDEALRDGERRGEEMRRSAAAAEALETSRRDDPGRPPPSPEARAVAAALTPPEGTSRASTQVPPPSELGMSSPQDVYSFAEFGSPPLQESSTDESLFTPSTQPERPLATESPGGESPTEETPPSGAAGAPAGSGPEGPTGGHQAVATPGGETPAPPRGGGPGQGAPALRTTTTGEGAPAPLAMESMGELGAGDLDLIDTELAEHQRWSGAAHTVGAAGSAERAAFVLNQIREGLTAGAAGGLGMGLSLGLLHRGLGSQLAARAGGRLAARMGGTALARTGEAAAAAARMAGRLGSRLGPRVAAQTARFTPLPAIGAVIGGVISFHSLYTRDWRQTRQTLANMGEGGSKYEKLANTIAGISEIVDIVSNTLNVIAGIMGAITVGLWIAAVLSAGALSPLAGTLTAITLAIGVVTLALDAINMLVLQPAVTLFRAMHAFTSESDPREVVADGQTLSAAAANNGGALGGLLGARGARIGRGRPNPRAPDTTRRSDDTPPPAEGAGPRVDFEARPTPPEAPGTFRPATDPGNLPPSPRPTAEAPPPARRVPEQLVLPGMEQALATPSAPPAPPAFKPRWQETRPDIVLPIEYPHAGVGSTDVGFAAPHRRQQPRGPSQISEHVIPGAQWESITTPPPVGGVPQRPVYESQTGRHYRGDTTVRVDTGVADYKTHTGPLSDNRRTRAIQDRIAADQPVNVVSDLYLPSIEQTRRAAAATPGSPLTPGQTVYGATSQLQHQFDIGTGRVRTGARNRDRGAELTAVGRAADPYGGVRDIDFSAMSDRPLPPHGSQLPLPGMEAMTPRPRPPEQLSLRFPERADPSQLPLRFEPTSPAAGRAPGGGSGAFRAGAETGTRSSEPVGPRQLEELTRHAERRGLPRENVVSSASQETGYGSSLDILRIGPDVNPLPPAQRPLDTPNPANAALAPRSVIDHEILGHREAAQAGMTHPVTDARGYGWAEEAQASLRASLLAPDMPAAERQLLIQDAAARFRFQDRPGTVYMFMEPISAETRARPPAPLTEVGVRPAAEPATPATGRPPAAAAPGPGTAAIAAQAARSVRGRTASDRGAAPSGSEPSLLQTFFPILAAGHHGPSPEEQRAAFNAQFAADFPPIPGEERANPEYTAPPCTPAQIAAIRGHIEELRQARAQTATAQAQMDAQLATHTANEEPLQQSVDTTASGLEALTQHDERLECTANANAAQQERQQGVSQAVDQYDDHSGAIDGLRTPLRAFQGMMDLASYLPGSAGRAMADMNRDATSMLASFDEMDATMASQQQGAEVCQEQLRGESEQIQTSSTEAATTQETMATANTHASALQERNTEAVADATRRRDAATAATETIDANIDEQEGSAETLAQQLQSWATNHRAARQAALAATQARVEALGLTVTATHER